MVKLCVICDNIDDLNEVSVLTQVTKLYIHNIK